MSRAITENYPVKAFNGITVNTSILSSSKNYYSYSSRNVKYIVMHYTGNSSDTAKANASYFNSGSRGASAHYFIDENNCYQSVTLNNAAWAVGGTTVYKHSECRNLNSVSIEMCTSGNYIVSDVTINNAAYLCAELCRYIGITASQIDTYVLRHYDVWNKSCPAQWATANSTGWTVFKAKVKAILNGNEEELTLTQYDELKTLITKQGETITKQAEEITALKTKVAERTGYYNYIDSNMPESYKPTIRKLVGRGLLQGNENSELMLTTDMMRILTILDRTGVFD